MFGANNIVNVWREKYVSIYNRGDFSCDKERLSTRLNDDCDNYVNNMVVSNSVVIGALDKLQVGRAVGNDGISAELLKICSAEAVIHWRCLFNMFLHYMGILLASCWKLNCVQYPKIRMGT